MARLDRREMTARREELERAEEQLRLVRTFDGDACCRIASDGHRAGRCVERT